ncbi:MAG: hypothetical protein R6X11_07200 [Desulfonatronovibrio sp.]
MQNIIDKTKDLDYEQKRKIALPEAKNVLNRLLKYTKRLKPETLKKQHQLYKNIKGRDYLEYHDHLKNGRDYLAYIQQINNYTKGTYYNLKAAYRHGIVLDLLEFVNNEKYHKSKVWIDDTIYRIEQINLNDPDPERVKVRKLNPEHEPVLKFKKSKYSKKTDLKLLPDNWRHKVVSMLPDKYRLAGKIVSMTGCRAKELAQGLFVRFDEDEVVIEIHGAKVTDHAGHETRKLFYSRKKFEREMEKSGLKVKRDTQVRVDKIRNFTDKVLKLAGQKAGFNTFTPIGEKNLVTIRTFRHQLSADLKKTGYTPKDIAAILGHRVTKTQNNYSSRRSGRGGHILPVRAEGTHEIKDNLQRPKHIREAGPEDNDSEMDF